VHFGFCNWSLQLYISQEEHMRLVIGELLSPCHFTHLVTRDIQLQNLVILMTRIFKFSYNNEISCHH
jgi:hypothetical protein